MVSEECSYRCGVCLGPQLVLLATGMDHFDREDSAFTRFAYFDRNDIAEPWGFTDCPGTTYASLTLWRHEIRVALEEEGRVLFFTRDSRRDTKAQIPDTGVFRPGAAGYGYVTRIRAIGQGLYVCGAHRQVYRYEPGARNVLSGRFVDIAGPMRQPPLSKPAAAEGPEFSAWAAQDIVQFNDIDGSSEADLYATGDQTAHFDGRQWRPVALPVVQETMHVVKVLGEGRVLIGGSNGYLLAGNAQEGFRNISHLDDNATITGLEHFNEQLFVATDKGLFTYDGASTRLRPVVTGLQPELQDAHLLQAMDGVLWSFGYKDLAYWDSAGGNQTWVRVHHPDNPRIGQAAVRVAASTAALAAEKADAAVADAPEPIPAWIAQTAQAAAPLAAHALPDLRGILARIGHKGAGRFLLEQLAPYGMTAEQLLRIQRKQRYSVVLAQLGLELVLQYQGPKRSEAEALQQPQHWGLAQIVLQAQGNTSWPGAWPGGLQPMRTDIVAQARQVWGEESAAQGVHVSFFVDGAHGAQCVVDLECGQAMSRLVRLSVMHLGGYLPWPQGA